MCVCLGVRRAESAEGREGGAIKEAQKRHFWRYFEVQCAMMKKKKKEGGGKKLKRCHGRKEKVEIVFPFFFFLGRKKK